MPTTGGISRTVIENLLARSVLDVEAGVMALPTMPLITSSVSIMPKRDIDAHSNSTARPQFRSVGPSRRFVISSNSFHYSSTHDAEVDSLARPPTQVMTVVATTIALVAFASISKDKGKEKTPEPCPFLDASISTSSTKPYASGLLDLSGGDFLAGCICTAVDIDPSLLEETYVLRWNVTNGSNLDDPMECREMINELAHP